MSVKTHEELTAFGVDPSCSTMDRSCEDHGHTPIIAVVGDARIEPNSQKAQIAFELGRSLVGSGYMVLTGGHAGIAREASRGAAACASQMALRTIALLPESEHSPDSPEFSLIIPTGLGLLRNALVAQSAAIVAIGGGAGTLSEIAYGWMYRRLIIAFRVEGWSGKLADKRVDGRIRYEEIKEDRVFGVDSAPEVLSVLTNYLPLYYGR